MWPLWWASLGIALTLLTAGLAASRREAHELERRQSELEALAAQYAVAADAARTAPALPADFTASLPRAVPMDKLLREVFRTASREGVIVVSAVPQEATTVAPNALAHATLVVRLTGSYGGIKAVLRDLLGRFPGSTLQQLRIQRAAGKDGEQEAMVTFQQWLRPVSARQASIGAGS